MASKPKVSPEECRSWRASDKRLFKIYHNSDYTIGTVRKHAKGRCRHAEEDAEDDTTYGGDTYHTRHGPEFEEAREQALERAGYRCERCGITDQEHRERDDLFGGGLHVHHKVDTTEFDDLSKAHDLSNLEVLCADCHGV